jgi:hypothetical protein
MSPREAPNSLSSAVKKAANEYAALKPTNIRVKAAATITHPYDPDELRVSMDRDW